MLQLQIHITARTKKEAVSVLSKIAKSVKEGKKSGQVSAQRKSFSFEVRGIKVKEEIEEGFLTGKTRQKTGITSLKFRTFDFPFVLDTASNHTFSCITYGDTLNTFDGHKNQSFYRRDYNSA